MSVKAVIIIDDHALFRTGLKFQVRDITPEAEIIECGSFDEALALTEDLAKVELVFADLSLPGIDWEEGINALKARIPDARIVVLSAHEELDYIKKALALGAAGYIPKAAVADEFLGALRLILDGGTYVPPVVLQAIGGTAPESKPAAAPDIGKSNGEELTPRQLEVLALLSDGLSNKEIGRALDLAPGTVKQHLSAIFRVLDARNRTEAVLRGASYLNKAD